MWIFVLFVVLAGCGGDGAAVESTAVSQERAGVHGQVRLGLSASELSVADTVELTLTTEAEEGWAVAWPPVQPELEGFLVLSERQPQPRLAEDGRIETSRTYVLEPELDGDYEIPALSFELSKGDGEARETESFATEPTIVRVHSAIEGEDAEQAELREIPDPESLPPGFPWWLLILAVALAAAGFGYWRWRRRAKPGIVAPTDPPHVIAERELAALAAAQLAEHGEFKAYFGRLSDILRHYIEGRFGLRAPEQTTEEFLQGLAHAPVLVGEHKDRLRRFLLLSDLVKFAKHSPRVEDAEESMGVCREFVAATKFERVMADMVEAGKR